MALHAFGIMANAALSTSSYALIRSQPFLCRGYACSDTRRAHFSNDPSRLLTANCAVAGAGAAAVDDTDPTNVPDCPLWTTIA